MIRKQNVLQLSLRVVLEDEFVDDEQGVRFGSGSPNAHVKICKKKIQKFLETGSRKNFVNIFHVSPIKFFHSGSEDRPLFVFGER
jgi:hypothetical protein